MADTIRSFIAIKLPAAVQQELRRIQQQLDKRIGRLVRWTRPEQLHVTLKFLGYVPAENLLPLEAALKLACAGVPPLNLKLGELGCFPSLARPNVLWVGLYGDLEQLKTLHARIEQETAPLAAHQEARDFKAHLTIARVKQPREARRAAQVLGEVQVQHEAWTANSVELMRSELSPAGAAYSVLASCPLVVDG